MSELIAYLFLALFVSFLCSLAESVLLSTPKTFLTSIKEKQSWANSFLKLKVLIWRPKIEEAIDKFDLYDFDIYHFESGMDFLKNEFFVKKLNQLRKTIICHYHGEDLRSRGIMPFIDKASKLNLTNEVDLLSKHPNINYLFSRQLIFSTLSSKTVGPFVVVQ